MLQTERPTLYTVKDGEIILNLSQPQTEIWEATENTLLALFGSQAGKTEFGVQWFKREIDNTFNPNDKFNDYIIGTSTFPLLDKKLQPEFLNVFRDIYDLGVFLEGKRLFTYYDKNIRIFLCSAENSDSLEAATAKAIWWDEAGQDSFRRQTWDAGRRRLNIFRGRTLITTTIYNWGWLKTEVYDRWLKGDKSIKVVQADSISNPAFPRESWDIAKATMAPWKFDMQHRGLYSRPAGMIYDSFDSIRHVKPRSEFPDVFNKWLVYVGMDFGTEHTAAMFYARDPSTGDMWAIHEYIGGKKPVSDHVDALKKLQGASSIARIYGGIRAEEGWRNDFGHYGWHVMERPKMDVDQGIQKVYAFHKSNKLFVLSDLENYIDEKQKYSRVLDENNNYQPTDKIKDKEWCHLCDAERAVLSAFDAVPSEAYSEKIIVRNYA